MPALMRKNSPKKVSPRLYMTLKLNYYLKRPFILNHAERRVRSIVADYYPSIRFNCGFIVR
jgi:hypothetical protein